VLVSQHLQMHDVGNGTTGSKSRPAERSSSTAMATEASPSNSAALWLRAELVTTSGDEPHARSSEAKQSTSPRRVEKATERLRAAERFGSTLRRALTRSAVMAARGALGREREHRRLQSDEGRSHDQRCTRKAQRACAESA